jgi:hypothetical protein
MLTPPRTDAPELTGFAGLGIGRHADFQGCDGKESGERHRADGAA